MNRIVAFCILFVVASCSSSCSFYKAMRRGKDHTKAAAPANVDTTKIAAVVPETKLPPKDTAIPAKDTSSLVKQMIEQVTPVWKKRLVYKTFTGKAKMHFETADSKLEFTAHIRIQKDSVIWINITALGGMFQAARILVTPDSFFMINYQQEEITRIPVSQANKLLPSTVDFSSLQNLIVGEPLRDGTITGVTDFGGSWTLQVEDSGYIQRLVYNKTDSTMRTAEVRTRSAGGPQVRTEYGSYLNTNNGKISTGRTLNIQNGNDVYSLDMNFSRIDFDLPLDFPFSFPSNYTVKQ